MILSHDQEKKNLLEFLATEVPGVQKRLEEANPKIFETIAKFEDEKGRFISNLRKIPFGSESFLFVLRKWNSYTPSLPVMGSVQPAIAQHSIGGGYFLHLQSEDQREVVPGYGLVIDPGYNFIHNFGLAGFSLDDIDGVLITHAHNDHTNDFESLLSILFQRNNRYLNRRSPKKIDLFFNIGSFKKFSNYLDLSSQNDKSYIGSVKVLSPGEVITIPERDDINCKLVALHSKHHEIVTANYSIGLCVSIGDRNILFTGDTGWSNSLVAKNDKVLMESGIVNQAEMSIDVLVSHIGSIKESEFKFGKPEDLEARFYDKHLGLLGVLSQIYHYKPELCIISEFGEELTALRQSLADEISNIAKKIRGDCTCLPGDVGLGIFLDSKCGTDYRQQKLVDWDALKYLDVLEPSGQRTIVYYSGEDQPVAADVEKIIVGKGLDVYRNHYKRMILAKLGNEKLDKYALMREVGEFRYDLSDPSVAEESERIINDLLIGLSCTLEDPREVLSLLLNECHAWSIIGFLQAYYLGSKFLEDFANAAASIGYGDHDKTIEEVLISKEASGYLRESIALYLADKAEDARGALEMANNVTLHSIWPKLSPADKVKVLISDDTVASFGKVDETTRIVAAMVGRYKALYSHECSMIEDLKVKYFPPDQRCWHAAYSIGLEDIERNLPSVDVALRGELLSEIAKVKEYTEMLNAIKGELQVVNAEIHAYLRDIGHDFMPDEDSFADTMEGLTHLGLLAAERKMPAADFEASVDKVGQIIEKREAFAGGRR